MATCTYPDGSQVVYDWTDLYQIEGLNYKANATATEEDIADFTYDVGMREETKILGNNTLTTKTYFNDNTLDKITVIGKGDLSFDYTYDANKNVTREANTGGVMANYSWDAGFDDADRINSWDRDNNTDIQSWTLSKVGNWDDVTRNGITDTRTHNDTYEVTQVSGQTVTYDPKGNQTVNQNQRNFEWDIDNHLKSTTHATEADASYEYDALGRRVSKTVGSNETIYICKGQQVVAEYVNGALTQKYIYASYIDEPVAMIKVDETKFYYHQNRQFNVAGITDSSGSIVELYAYETYGKATILNASGTVLTASTCSNPYQFTGRRFDTETGNHYFRARYYDQEQGRFISRDPLGYIDGMGLYNGYFAENHALDPFGTVKWHGGDSGKPRARVILERGDTINDVAKFVNLDAKDFKKWLDKNSLEQTTCTEKVCGRKIKDMSTNEKVICNGGTVLSVPNTVYVINNQDYSWWNTWAFDETEQLGNKEGYLAVRMKNVNYKKFIRLLKDKNLYGLVIVSHGAFEESGWRNLWKPDQGIRGSFDLNDGWLEHEGEVFPKLRNILPRSMAKHLKYKLGGLKMIVCYGGHVNKKANGGNFKDLVSENGTYYARDRVFTSEHSNYPVGADSVYYGFNKQGNFN